MFNLIPNDSICVDNYNDAAKLMLVLTDNNYVPMLTKEDSRYIVSYIWEPDCNRNGMVFVSREDWDEAEMNGDIMLKYDDDDVVIFDEPKEDDEWTEEEYKVLERKIKELVP